MGISTTKKVWAIRVFIVFVVLYAAYASYIVWAMRQPPETFARVMSHMPGPAVFLTLPFETLWTRERAGELRPGDAAPDFSLLKLDKTERVQLSALTAHTPVVLVFGSYT
ncbi:MAG TPA: hypothetical protein VLL05_09275 [Terriglobales bacterium]|nr:hypothetical protein [Terriglobales bacterium]